MDIDVRHLRLIAAIAETGSVTKAGLAVHVSQSAASHALCDLESRLNTLLFHRVGRRMVPTEAGRDLAHRAADILNRLSQAEDHVKRGGTGERGTLRLGTQCYTGYHWLPPLLAQFRRAHPGIRIEIKADSSANPVGAVVEGSLDLALAFGPIQNPLITARRVFNERMMVVMSAKHRLATQTYIRPTDFQDEVLFLHSKPSDSFVCQDVLAPAGVTPKMVETVALTEAIVELAKAGLGIGVLADWVTTSYLKGGQLVAIPLTQRGITRDWFAVTLKASRGVAYVKDFIDLLATKSPAHRAPRLRVV